MVTSSGYTLQPGINLPTDAQAISIGEDGVISAQIPGQASPITVGNLQLTDFVNPAGLQPRGQNLYLETVREARNMRAERYPFPAMAGETSAEEKLYDFVSALLRRLTALQAAPWQVKLLMRELMDPTDACRMLVKDYFRPMFDALLAVVDELVDEPLEPHERLKSGFSIIGQCLHYRYAGEVVNLMVPDDQRPAFEVDQIADHITRFCLCGLQGYSSDAAGKIRQDQRPTPEHPPEL